MAELDIRVHYEALGRAAAMMSEADDIAKEEMAVAANESITFGQAIVAKYPPEPPNSSYDRTGTLGRRWQTTVNPFSMGIRAVLKNPTSYGPKVQDEDEQAKIHRGRWPTVQMLLRAPAKRMLRFFQQAASRAISRIKPR